MLSDNDRVKLQAFFDAMENLEGVHVPFNIICDCFAPLRKWVVSELNIVEEE